MTARRILFFVITASMIALIVLSSVPDLLRLPQAEAIFAHLGYPPYLLRFLGTAKALAVVAILVPGLPRLKEWAFAGLLIDVTGALFSHLSVGDAPAAWMPAAIGLVLVTGSYVAYRMESSVSTGLKNGDTLLVDGDAQSVAEGDVKWSSRNARPPAYSGGRRTGGRSSR
jgi:uncharacterized membrane protein YphA (DoxX/SURF4 family)